MSIIIRLQNLPWDASTLNIRQFFFNLSIPDGGVHIIGGEKGDAFIAFSTDEDARQAMKNDGGHIGNTQIKLFLSSKTEMQNVITLAREAAEMNQEPQSRPQTGQSSFNQFNEGQQFSRSRELDVINHKNEKIRELAERSNNGFNSQKNDFGSHAKPSRPLFNDNFESVFDAKKPFYEQNPQPPLMASHSMSGPNNSFGSVGNLPRLNQVKPLMDTFDAKKDLSRGGFQRDIFNKPDNWSDPIPRGGGGFGGNDHRRNNFRGERGMEANRVMDRGMEANRGMDRGMVANRGIEANRGMDRGMDGNRGVDGNRGMGRGMNNQFQENFSNNNSFRPDITMNLLAGFQNNTNNLNELNLRNNFQISNNSMPPFKNNSFNNFERHDFEEPNGYCVVLENVPVTYSNKDIRSLLKECKFSISSLKLDHSRNGRRSGKIYLRLTSITYLENILRLNGKLVHGKRLIVERCPDREYSQVNEGKKRKRSRSRSPSPHIDGFFLVIKNLQYSSIFKLIGGAKVADSGGPFAETKSSGLDSGHVLVRMAGKDDMDSVLKQFRKVIDGHVTLVFQISEEEFEKRIIKSRLLTIDNTTSNVNKSDTCVRIVGLSWNSEEKEIRKFFSDCKIPTDCVHMLQEKNGNNSGTAFVEFETYEDSHRAQKKNKEYLDGRYLVISGQIKEDMLTMIERNLSQGKTFKNNTVERINGFTVKKPIPVETIVYMKNLSFRTQLEDILEFFEGFQVLPDSVHLQYKDDIPTGDGMIKFDSKIEAKRAISKLDRRDMLGRTVHLMF